MPLGRLPLAIVAALIVAGWVTAAAPQGRAAIPPPAPCAGPECWDPAPTTEPWQWQLQARIDLSVPAPVYDIDVDNAASVVDAIHAQGARAICYFSVGSHEPFRDDADRFPRHVLGRRVARFENERWLDIRKQDVLRSIMEDRFDVCAEKGFDAVEPDLVDGYQNPTGFQITRRDQLRYDAWIANAVHERRMAVGLKNNLGQARRLLPYFDFAVNEQCFQYRECDVLDPFIAAGKPVFGAEYRVPLSRFCERSIAHGFSTIKKRFSLRAFRRTCPPTSRAPAGDP
ncbi:MAG TPA: endo alpha-1,4 polygalactosaminidase [Solirubrobacterales bacterium]|nr:endo alpha-1,4 polygalactosaminidase [Solirubrobacterales bacterium]